MKAINAIVSPSQCAHNVEQDRYYVDHFLFNNQHTMLNSEQIQIIDNEDRCFQDYDSDCLFQDKSSSTNLIYPDVFRRTRSKKSVDENNLSTIQLYEMLKAEIQNESEKTRNVVCDESKKLKNDIIDCIKENPISTLELFSKLIIVCSLFSLLVWFIAGFAILNPFFAIFLIASSISGVVMSKIRRSDLLKVDK